MTQTYEEKLQKEYARLQEETEEHGIFCNCRDCKRKSVVARQLEE